MPSTIAFTAAVLGGIGNIPGAVIGAIIIGMVRSLCDTYFDTQWTETAVFAMYCYWEGEAKLGTLDGVISTRIGDLEKAKHYIELLMRPPAASEAQAGLHFVEDQKGAALVRQST